MRCVDCPNGGAPSIPKREVCCLDEPRPIIPERSTRNLPKSGPENMSRKERRALAKKER